MQDDARSVLAQVISTHGQEVVDDHRRLRSILADRLPGARREAQRLVAAAEEGIPRQILDVGADPTGALRLQLAMRLQDERDMTSAAAEWTVDAWASALDVDLGAHAVAVSGERTWTERTRTEPAHQDDDLPPPPPRRGLWLTLAALAGLVVAMVFLANVNPFGLGGQAANATPTLRESPSERPTADPTDTPEPATPRPTLAPTPEPDPEEQLLARVNGAIRDTCSPGSWEIGEPIAQVNCEAAGMDLIAYLLFDAEGEMRDAYQKWVYADQDQGNCSSGDVPSEHGWAVVRTPGNELGRYSCFLGDGKAWIIWTTEYANILALGYRADEDFGRLWNAWARREVRPLRGVGP